MAVSAWKYTISDVRPPRVWCGGLALQNSKYRAGLARTTPPKEQQDDWAKLGLLLFFFAYAIAFICAFEKVFGLPQSAM